MNCRPHIPSINQHRLCCWSLESLYRKPISREEDPICKAAWPSLKTGGAKVNSRGTLPNAGTWAGSMDLDTSYSMQDETLSRAQPDRV